MWREKMVLSRPKDIVFSFQSEWWMAYQNTEAKFKKNA